MFDFIGEAILLALVILFGWLTLRAWGSKRAWLKWVGLVLSGLLTLILALVTLVSLYGFVKLNQKHPNPVASATVAGTPEQLARGEKLAKVCAGCHSPTSKPPLVGQDFLEGFPMGTLYSANLTPTHLGSWSDGEIIRAIREGVSKNGRSLIIMPSYLFHGMSDDDVQSVVAYLRSQPAAGTTDNPPTNLNVLGAVFIVLMPFQTVQPAITGPVARPPEGPTAEYGEYLTNIIGCRDCHGANLTGGAGGLGPPPGPNLTVIVPNWTEEQFVTLIRTGRLPDGSSVSDDMPWKEINDLASDDDVRALYAYLHGLTPVPSP